MGPTVFLIAQAAAASAQASAPAPDIEIKARVEARSVDIRQKGAARIELRADPGAAPPVEVVRSAPAGQASYRNLTIAIHGVARLTAPAPIAAIDSKATTGDAQ